MYMIYNIFTSIIQKTVFSYFTNGGKHFAVTLLISTFARADERAPPPTRQRIEDVNTDALPDSPYSTISAPAANHPKNSKERIAQIRAYFIRTIDEGRTSIVEASRDYAQMAEDPSLMTEKNAADYFLAATRVVRDHETGLFLFDVAKEAIPEIMSEYILHITRIEIDPLAAEAIQVQLLRLGGMAVNVTTAQVKAEVGAAVDTVKQAKKMIERTVEDFMACKAPVKTKTFAELMQESFAERQKAQFANLQVQTEQTIQATIDRINAETRASVQQTQRTLRDLPVPETRNESRQAAAPTHKVTLNNDAEEHKEPARASRETETEKRKREAGERKEEEAERKREAAEARKEAEADRKAEKARGRAEAERREADAKRKVDAEAKKQAAAEEARQKADEAKKKQEEADAKRKADAEAAKKRKEEAEEQRRQQREERERLKKCREIRVCVNGSCRKDTICPE